MRNRALLGIITVVVTAAALVGCGQTDSSSPAESSDSSTPRNGGTVTAAIDSDPGNFDTLADQSLGQSTVNNQIYDALTRIGANGEVEPGLAESWTQDATQLVLTLRSGVSFTDGTPFDADAVVFNMDRILGPTSSYASLFSSVQSVEATDPTSVTFTLTQPDSSVLSALATRAAYIVSPAAVEEYGEDYGSHPVGTGPFVLDSYTANNEVVLTKNPDYWQTDQPYLDGVTFRVVTDETSKVVALIDGQVQTVDYVSPVNIARVQERPDLSFANFPGILTPYIPVNFNSPPLDDPDVREAISLALDRVSISDDVLFGYAKAANSMLPPAYIEYDSGLPRPDRDLAKAKELLGGKTINVTMQVPPTYTDLAQVVQQQLGEAGIIVKLENMDWGTLVDNFFEQNFELQLQDFTGQWPNAQVTLSGFFGTGGAVNGLGFSDPAIDTALSSAATAVDEAAASPFYQEAQRLAGATNVYIPVVWIDNLRASASALRGLPELPTGTLDFRSAWLN